MIKIKHHLKEMNTILEEINIAKDNFNKVISELSSIDTRYQKKEFDYRLYTQLKKRLLLNKSPNHIINSYNIYMSSLKEKLVQLNSKIFDIIYNEESYNSLVIGRETKKEKPEKSLPSLDALEIGEAEMPIENIEVSKVEKQIKEKEAEEEKKETPEIELLVPKPEALDTFKAPPPVKMGFLKRLIYAFQAKEKPWLEAHENDKVAFGGIFSMAFLRYLLEGKEKRRNLFGETQILPSILSYEDQDKIDKELGINKKDILDPYLLERQIKELKSLISRKKPEVYKASTLGYLANISVRKVSIFFIEKFPDFFKKLYQAIRYANLKILANTYINIVFFLTIFSGLISIPLLTVIFALQGDPSLLVIVKTIGSSLLISNIVFWLAYYYPFMKAKTRKQSINTNLPFAIDHMSSVISSGVSPATMFKLLSSSSEYGDISIELEKVTNYVDFFGYDILTALKAVAISTPSEDFKEFLDGFVSTIETGGDLKDYLSQKSSEALLNYRLERQKYVESLSTYSDIYTGVLIAAPLFFVTSLSLISVLGGTIGGLSVDTIISLGTYAVIPILNILFIIFLEVNQPEI